MLEWGRLNFHMAIDEGLTRPDDSDLGRWYRLFCRDLLHQDNPQTTLGRDVIDSARRQTEADRKRRQRDLRKERDNVPQCPPNVPQCPDKVPIADSDNDSSSTRNSNKRNTGTRAKKDARADERRAHIAELKAELTALHPDFPSTWEKWEASRQKNRKPLTDTSAEGQLEKLLGMTRPIQALKDSINGDWQGIFDPDDKAGVRAPVARTGGFKNQFDHMNEFGEWIRNGGNNG